MEVDPYGPSGWKLAGKRRGTVDLTVPFVLAVTLMVALVGWPRLGEIQARGRLNACRGNLRTLATALEMYSSDNGGRYPLRLAKLLCPGPDGKAYLCQIPTCPSAGRDTYRHYRATTQPDDFSLYCQGDNHHQALGGRANTRNLPSWDMEPSCCASR